MSFISALPYLFLASLPFYHPSVSHDTLKDMVSHMSENVGVVHQLPLMCDGQLAFSRQLEQVKPLREILIRPPVCGVTRRTCDTRTCDTGTCDTADICNQSHSRSGLEVSILGSTYLPMLWVSTAPLACRSCSVRRSSIAWEV